MKFEPVCVDAKAAQCCSFRLALCVALAMASSGCVATVEAHGAYDGAVVYDDNAAIYEIDTYPRYEYNGVYVYLVGDRWYYLSGGRWAYYREEPPVLFRYRSDYYVRYGYAAPPRYGAPPAYRGRYTPLTAAGHAQARVGTPEAQGHVHAQAGATGHAPGEATGPAPNEATGHAPGGATEHAQTATAPAPSEAHPQGATATHPQPNSLAPAAQHRAPANVHGTTPGAASRRAATDNRSRDKRQKPRQ